MFKESKSVFSIQVAPQSATSQPSYIHGSVCKNDTPKKLYYEFKLRMEVLKNFGRSILSMDFERHVLTSCSGLYVVMVILMNVIFTLPTTLVPQKDIIKHPESWIEKPLMAFQIPIIHLFWHHFDYVLIMDNCNSYRKKNLIVLFVCINLALFTTYISLNMVWIHVLDLRPPIPFIESIVFLVIFITLGITFWLLHTSNTQDPVYRARLKWYILSRVANAGINQVYLISTALFETCPTEFQPALALMLPVLRYGSGWMQNKIVNKIKEENEIPARFAVTCRVACNHALYLSIIFGSTATVVTASVICATDAILNLKSCFHISRLYGEHVSEEPPKIKINVQNLVTKETLKVLLTITYCLIFCIAYFGPNAEILGNIKNDYWQYRKVEDITVPLTKLAIFLLVDLLRIMLNSFILWKNCRISLYSEYCKLMGTYWKPITMYVTLQIFMVSSFVRNIFRASN